MSTGARTNVGVSYPTKLRATLRAPPAKWAIKAFFLAGERSEPRSRTARRAPADRSPRRAAGRAASVVPCRVLSLVLSFASKESTAPIGAAAPPSAPESARQAPNRKMGCACGRTKGLSARPLETFGYRSWREIPRTVSPDSRRSRRVDLPGIAAVCQRKRSFARRRPLQGHFRRNFFWQ